MVTAGYIRRDNYHAPVLLIVSKDPKENNKKKQTSGLLKTKTITRRVCCRFNIKKKRSTFRHDLKIKTSDEGRVMKTAAAFAKGFLELEGELTPILVSLVSKESSKNNSVMMLDPSGNKHIKKDMERRWVSGESLSQCMILVLI